MFSALRSHKLYVPLITIACSVGLFLIYYFFYVASQRSYANERAFRLLGAVSDQMMKRTENLKNILAALATSEKRDYLKHVANDEITNIETKPKGCHAADRDGTLQLRLLTDEGGFSMQATYRTASTPVCTLSATVDVVADLRRRFRSLTGEYFDDILIATSSGEVLFQQNLTGLRIRDLSALARPPVADGKAGDAAKAASTSFQTASQFSNVIDSQLGDSLHKLYLQPVPLSIRGPKDEDLKLVVCGLWRTDRLQSDVVAIPYSVLIWGSLTLLVFFALGWPLLKLAYMSNAERLRRRHIFYLLFSALCATSLLSLIVLNYSYVLSNREESQEQLKSLADRIDQNLKTEVSRAVQFSKTIGASEWLHQAFRKQPRNWTTVSFLEEGSCAALANCAYPYFDNMFWADETGQQQYKLTVRPHATPRTNVGKESYFLDARDKRNLIKVDGKGPEFSFDAVYSPNTGEFLVVLATPYQLPADWNDVPPAIRRVKVQVMAARFLTLVEPVLPNGYGFAVVGHDGMVQFHSNAGHNQIEDFFKESRQDPALKDLVINQGSDFLDVNYTGKRQQIYIKPLRILGHPAPALIVFRDTNYFNAVNVACVLVFMLLTGVFGIVFLAAAIVYVFRPGDYPLTGLWPTTSDTPRYVSVMAANLCLGLAFGLRFPAMDMNETLLAVMVILVATAIIASRQAYLERWPLVARILVAAAVAGVARGSWGLVAVGLYLALSHPPVAAFLHASAVKWIKVKDLFLGAVLSVLAVLVWLPCLGMFRISYNAVNRVALESAQLAERDALLHRAEQVDSYFSSLRAVETSETPTVLVRYAETRRRENLDRYDEAIYNPENAERVESRDPPDTSKLEPSIVWASGFFPSNQLGSELREAAAVAPHGKWQWTSAPDKNGDDQQLWLHKLTPSKDDSTEGDGLFGVYPLWRLYRKAELLGVFLALLLAVWLRFLIRKVFLTDLEDVPPLENWVARESGRNLLVIGHPQSGKGGRAAALPDVDVVDLRRMVTTKDWTLPELTHKTTVVDHLEADMDNPESCARKLDLLERLLFVERKYVLLISAVDPIFYLASAGLDGKMLDRWAAVLALFKKKKMEDVTVNYFARIMQEQETPCREDLIEMVRDECDHTAQLRRIGLDMLEAHCAESIPRGSFVEELVDRADSYYRVLWSTCTKEERLVLFQLAQDGWVNPKNARAIQQLQRRGIIRRGSGYRIMNDSFCYFVRNGPCPADVAAWEQEEQHSAWSAVKVALSTAALMFGAWLLYAQQDVFQLGIGYVAALGTAGGAVLNLARTLTGQKNAASSGGH